ncbi:MAG: hypothetical protein R3C03_01160 [Pirellulaceae bacterium]
MERPPVLLVRTDGNSTIGWGHFTRCLAVAEQWTLLGGVAHFLLGDTDNRLQQNLDQKGIEYSFVGVADDLQVDAARTAKLAGELHVAWVLLDSYRIDQSFVRAVKEQGRFVARFDDANGSGEEHEDLVINGNAHTLEQPTHYVSHIKLLGLRFLAVRQEIIRDCSMDGGHSRRDNGNDQELASKVLIALGGTFSIRLLQELVDGIETWASKRRTPVHARVLCGGSDPSQREDLEAIVSTVHVNVTFVDPTSLIREHYVWAKLSLRLQVQPFTNCYITVFPLLASSLPTISGPAASALRSLAPFNWSTDEMATEYCRSNCQQN